MSIDQLFAMESVCKKWQKCAKQVITEKDTLEPLIFDQINHKNISIIKTILTKCLKTLKTFLNVTQLIYIIDLYLRSLHQLFRWFQLLEHQTLVNLKFEFHDFKI